MKENLIYLKHTTNPNEMQQKHIQNNYFKEAMTEIWKFRKSLCVLCNKFPFIKVITENSEIISEVIYININTFMIILERYKNIKELFNILIKKKSVYFYYILNLYTNKNYVIKLNNYI